MGALNFKRNRNESPDVPGLRDSWVPSSDLHRPHVMHRMPGAEDTGNMRMPMARMPLGYL